VPEAWQSWQVSRSRGPEQHHVVHRDGVARRRPQDPDEIAGCACDRAGASASGDRSTTPRALRPATASGGTTVMRSVDSTWRMRRHLRTKPAAAVVHLRLHLDRARLRIHRVGDREMRPLKVSPGRPPGRSRGARRRGRNNRALRHLRRDRHRAQVGDRHDARARIVPEFAGDDAGSRTLPESGERSTTSWLMSSFLSPKTARRRSAWLSDARACSNPAVAVRARSQR
jgi:hypothetical protein